MRKWWSHKSLYFLWYVWKGSSERYNLQNFQFPERQFSTLCSTRSSLYIPLPISSPCTALLKVGLGEGLFPLGELMVTLQWKGKSRPWRKVLFWSSPFLLLEGSHRPVFSTLKWNNIVIVVTSKLFYMLEMFLKIDLHLVLNRWSITFMEPNIFYFHSFLIF